MTRKEGIYHLLLTLDTCARNPVRTMQSQVYVLLQLAARLGVITGVELAALRDKLLETTDLAKFNKYARKYLKSDYTLTRYCKLCEQLHPSNPEQAKEPQKLFAGSEGTTSDPLTNAPFPPAPKKYIQ